MRYATCGPQWVSNRLWLAVVGAVALTAGITVPMGGSPASATSRSTAGTSAAAAAWPEVPGLRTATSQTYRGPNGQLRTELHAAPINYRSGNGWQKIDSRLVATPLGPHPARDGVVDEYAYHNAANAWQADFKNRLTAGFLQLSVQGQSLSFGLAGASPSTAHASGSDITYPQAFTGTDLREAITPTGVKESLTLGSARAPARYTFHLTTPVGVAGHALPDGGYEFGTAGGSFVLSPPFAEDAAQVRAARGQLGPAPDGRHASLRVSRHGTDWTIAVAIDQRWLTATGRSFPVTVDPSITVQSYQAVTWSFSPTCDSTCTGYVGPQFATDNDMYNNVNRAGLQFDLTGVPAGANVASATLSLYHQRCWGAPTVTRPATP